MDHLAYLDAYQSLTDPALADIALQLGRGDVDAATAALAALRAQQDALWETYKASAQQQVKP